MIVVRMLLSGELRTVTKELAKQLIETKKAIPVTAPERRYAVVPTSNREHR